MNTTIRNKIRFIAYFSLKVLSNLYLINNSSIKTPILVYHRVCPLYFKKSLVYANVFPDEFENQMKYLSNNYETLTISEYLNRKKNNSLSGNEVCITFDDGFKDNYIYAYPILKKYKLKATIFLVTKYIGENKPFPWIKLDKGGKRDLKFNLINWLPLSWDEIKEMSEYGIEFGPHSHTHTTSLSKMSYQEAKDEIQLSTQTLYDNLGYFPNAFCFPHGTIKDFNVIHINILKSLGYKAALTTMQGRNSVNENPFNLKRLIIYEEDSITDFIKKVNGKYDFVGFLQKIWLYIFGTGI